MGLQETPYKWWIDTRIEISENDRWNKGVAAHPMVLQYDCLWEYLMPVVEKICQVRYDDGETAYLRTFGMINHDGEFMVRFNRSQLGIGDTLHAAAYDAVLKFLKYTYYNHE